MSTKLSPAEYMRKLIDDLEKETQSNVLLENQTSVSFKIIENKERNNFKVISTNYPDGIYEEIVSNQNEATKLINFLSAILSERGLSVKIEK